jgi:hypothetical protein
MDDYLFDSNVERCKVVFEKTHYLEIFNYSVRMILPTTTLMTPVQAMLRWHSLLPLLVAFDQS